MMVFGILVGCFGAAGASLTFETYEELYENGPVRNVDTGKNFTSIQEAIDDLETLDGHTITVESGIYMENVHVNKTLTLMGAGRDNTTIDAMGEDIGVQISANNSVITGFTITNATGEDMGIALLVAYTIGESSGDEPPPTLPMENATVADMAFSYSNIGAGILNVSGSDIHHCAAFNNSEFGFILYSSGYNMIHNNTAFDNLAAFGDPAMGIAIMEGHGNTLRFNTVTNNNMGMILFGSDDNMLGNNEANYNTAIGIALMQSSENTLESNNASMNWNSGINIVEGSNGNLARDNMVLSNGFGGLVISESENNSLEGNEARENQYGIVLVEGARWNHIIDNHLNSNLDMGLFLVNSTENHVEYNRFIENENGIVLIEKANRNTIEKNNFTSNEGGIIMMGSTNNTILENSFSLSETAVFVFNANDTTVLDNQMSDCTHGIFVLRSQGASIRGNTFVECQAGVFMNEAVGNEIRSNEARDGYYGFLMNNSHHNVIAGNTVTDGAMALFIQISHNNTVADNIFSRNEDWGMYILHSNDTAITNNMVEDNHNHGILVQGGHRSVIHDNRFTDNPNFGLYLISTDSLVYRNIFIGNGNNSRDDSPGANAWDAGDPALGHPGGNYWDDYTGVDRGDGIGEPEHDIPGSANSKDNFPWMNPDFIHPVAGFDVSADDITAGEIPVMEISDLMDTYGGVLDGEYTVEIDIDGDTRSVDLIFTEGQATYDDWDSISEAGEYAIQVTIDDVLVDETFHVLPGPVHTVTVNPEGDQTTVEAGEELVFHAEAVDGYSNLITDVTTEFTWVGADENGLFVRETTGTYNVYATYQGTESLPVQMTVVPGDVASIDISPNDSTIIEGESETYTAMAYDGFGNEIGDVTGDTVWSVETGAGGSWDENTYTSENPGTWTITGTYDGITGTAQLTVEEIVVYTLSIVSDDGGTTDPVPGDHTYEEGASVIVIAIPDDGWTFSHWTGDYPEGEDEESEITLTMDDHKTLTAHFIREEIIYTLTISSGRGGTTYPEQRTHEFREGTTIEILAISAVGWRLSHWTGDYPEGKGEEASFTLVMDGNKILHANFEEVHHTLVMAAEEGGTTDPAPGASTYREGTSVNIRALAQEGWRFSHWTGDYPEGQRENPDFTFTIEGNITLTAHFVEDEDDDETSDFLSDYGLYILILVLIVVILLVVIMVRGRSTGSYGSYDDDDFDSIEEDMEDEPVEEDSDYEL